MPIPDFDHNNVVPPHLGNPTRISEISPYPSDTFELCVRFGTSPSRRKILRGLIEFRLRMSDFGICTGFQWIDGSFTENVEVTESRVPNDLDIVTFYFFDNEINKEGVMNEFQAFLDPDVSKELYLLDHFNVDILAHPFNTVAYTQYWSQLFSHNRRGVWKGMIRLDLNTIDVDRSAMDFLNSFDDD